MGWLILLVGLSAIRGGHPLDASEEDVTSEFDGLLDEIDDEDLTEVFSEFFVPVDE